MPFVKRAPAGGLPPRIYLPIVAVCTLVVVAVIAYFLKTALVTTGSVLGPSGGQSQAAPAGARDNVLGGSQPAAQPGGGQSVAATPKPLRSAPR